MTDAKQASVRQIRKCRASMLGVGGANIVTCSFRSCAPRPIFLGSRERLPKCH